MEKTIQSTTQSMKELNKSLKELLEVLKEYSEALENLIIAQIGVRDQLQEIINLEKNEQHK
jgi:hypothetical protein